MIQSNTPILDLGLTYRAYNALSQGNVLTLGDLCAATPSELLRLPNFGRKSLRDVESVLADMGKKLKDPWPTPAYSLVTMDERIRQIVRDELRAHGLIK